MSDQFNLFNPPTSPDTPNATSSRGSASGVIPSVAPAGPTTAPSGADPAPASLFRQRAREAGTPTNGICGPLGFGSSPSADLTFSLASRLRVQTDLLGSTLYRLTWSERATPSGRSIFALRASGRRTSDSGCTSWRSPSAQEPGISLDRLVNRDGTPWTGGERTYDRETGRLAQAGVTQEVHLTSWPTPRTPTGGPESGERKKELGRTESGGGDLQATAQLASWATPAGRDWKDTPGMSETGVNPDGSERTRLDQLPRQAALATASGPTPPGSPAGTGSGGQLNPAFSRWLMGLPPEWDACGVTAMQSLRPSRKRS